MTRCPALGAAQRAADRATPPDWLAVKLTAPCLVVQGLADRVHPRVDERLLRDQLGPHVRLVNVPGAGHMMFMEQPATVAEAVLSFLRQQA